MIVLEFKPPLFDSRWCHFKSDLESMSGKLCNKLSPTNIILVFWTKKMVKLQVASVREAFFADPVYSKIYMLVHGLKLNNKVCQMGVDHVYASFCY